MITKLIGVATLFTAGSLMAGGSPTMGATPVQSFGAEAALTHMRNVYQSTVGENVR